MRKALSLWIRKERVLCIAAVCALLTMLLVPPDGAYPSYIDLRVLALLFCLMAVVAGVQRCGAFQAAASALLHRSRNGRVLGITLVLLPFFSSMLVTNDVALLTFVPFTMALLEELQCRRTMIPLLVLQTIAANLGSMATPVGNPQNLYLYSAYDLHPAAFFSTMFPLTLVSLVCLTAAAIPVLPRSLPDFDLSDGIRKPRHLAIYSGLFLLCLLTVFRVLPWPITLLVVLGTVFCLDRDLLKHLDYALLATFVCFFIVSGNLGRVDAVQSFLQFFLDRSVLLTAVLTSQIISNVPAAVLLSTFTDAWRPLLEGVNIGGLGTPIASLASLITLKLYLAHPGAEAGRYLTVFILSNVAGLLLLLVAALL